MQENLNKYPLLEYCWKHRLLGMELKSVNGSVVEVIDQGLYNRNDCPTFFNAKLKINGTLWIGNVVCLDSSDEWFERCWNIDDRYDNVILVVCEKAAAIPVTSKHDGVMMVEVGVPDYVQKNYDVLMSDKGAVHCNGRIKDYSVLLHHAWLAALQTEYVEQESNNVIGSYRFYNDWQSAYEDQLFAAFGFGVNEVIMKNVCRSIPKSFLWSDHVDDPFQLEAVFFGQAGLLDLNNSVQRLYQKTTLNEGYFTRLRNEWMYLSKKYSMPEPVSDGWKPLGRGQHIRPHVLLSALANLFYARKTDVGHVLGAESIGDLYSLISTHPTPYWETHSHFGCLTRKSEKRLTRNRAVRIIMACHIPFLFAYGRDTGMEKYCDLAFDLMEQMKGFRSAETAWFERFGVKAETAGDSMALCQLRNSYCGKHDCLRCRFGYEFIKNNK